MGIGIQICGLNGCGKSTLGKALAERTGFHFIDNEMLYFSRTQSNDPYENPRSQEEAKRLLTEEVQAHPNFIFSAVKGDYGAELISKYNYVVVIEVPKDVRSQRIRDRSFQKFGSRMLPGGDLYEKEESFFRFAAARQEDYVEQWLKTVRCPIIRVDGTKPIAESVASILEQIKG